MIELFKINTYELEILPVVFTVTGKTLLPFYFRRGVITFTRGYSFIYFRMACKAFFVCLFIPEYMALGTIGNSLQFGMGIGKITRGELC